MLKKKTHTKSSCTSKTHIVYLHISHCYQRGYGAQGWFALAPSAQHWSSAPTGEVERPALSVTKKEKKDEEEEEKDATATKRKYTPVKVGIKVHTLPSYLFYHHEYDFSHIGIFIYSNTNTMPIQTPCPFKHLAVQS